MDAWVFWLILGTVLAIAEVLTLTFVLAMIAGGAAVAAVVAALGMGTTGQVIVFAVADVALLGGVLPVARRHRRTPPEIRSGTARLVGTRAMTVSKITTEDGGQIRIGGDTWSARPAAEGVVIPADVWVDIIKIDGATAVVEPVPAPSPSSQ